MQTDQSPKHDLRHTLRLRQAIRFVWGSGRWWTVAHVVFISVQGVLPLVLLYLMKLVVDSVTAGLSSPDKEEAFGQVIRYVALAGGVTLLAALCGSVATLIKEQQTQAVADHMHSILHAKSVEVDLEYYETPEYYDMLHRAQQEGPYRPYSIVNGLVLIGNSGVSLAAMAGLLLSFHWAVSVALFAAVFPGVIVHLKYAGKMYFWQRRNTPAERQAAYLNSMLTGDEFAKELRLFGLGSLLMDRYRHLRKRLRRERFEIAKKRSIADLVAQSGATLAVVGSYAFIAYRTVHGSITLGDMVMYYGAFQRGLGNLRQMLIGLASLYEDSLFLSNFYEFLELKPRVKEPVNPRPFPEEMREGIVFSDVSFQYPTDGRIVLDHVNMTIPPGETVALVGENGSGKTTLIKLLCRLYDPIEGSITLNGVDLRDFETLALRRGIGVVFQDYVHYNLTARENIWFGDVGLPPDHGRIIDAAQDSGAHDVIATLRHGYDTILGKWFEEGEELSVGEWQKMALARAFLRNAQIIVLDEPTSNMDARAEYEVFKRFRRLSQGRTAILISHRFSTVRMADRIFVLEGGRVIETGTHRELVRCGGKYARMFETQAQYYR